MPGYVRPLSLGGHGFVLFSAECSFTQCVSFWPIFRVVLFMKPVVRSCCRPTDAPSDSRKLPLGAAGGPLCC